MEHLVSVGHCGESTWPGTFLNNLALTKSKLTLMDLSLLCVEPDDRVLAEQVRARVDYITRHCVHGLEPALSSREANELIRR